MKEGLRSHDERKKKSDYVSALSFAGRVRSSNSSSSSTYSIHEGCSLKGVFCWKRSFFFSRRWSLFSSSSSFRSDAATPKRVNNVWLFFIRWTNFECKPLSTVALLDAKTPRLLM